LPPQGSLANADRLRHQRDMPFFQDPPRFSNAYEVDPLLREYLFRRMGGSLAVTQLLEVQV
jgi:hypothetical protein